MSNFSRHKHPNTTTSSSSSSSTTTTTHACAACKYQRRKCQPDCVLAPYFPHDRQRQFNNAHKLFGVSNITKIIRNLSPDMKDEAMRTIIFQSDARASDPVLGCYRIVRDLQRQIEYSQAELEIVLRQLDICRAQAAVHVGGCEVVDDVEFPGPNSDFTTEGAVADAEGFDSGCVDRAATMFTDFNVAWAMQDPALLVMPFDVVQKKQSYVNGCEDVKRLLDVANDQEDLDLKFEFNGNGIDYDRREEVSVDHQDPSHVRSEDESSYLQFVQDHDLKGAATLFTLTNC